MKDINLSIKKNNLSGLILFTWNVKKIFIYLALIIPLFFSNCTEEEPIPILGEEIEEATASDQAKLFDGNQNMLTGGVITAEFKDSPMGFGINKLVDNNENTVFSTPHDKFSILWNGSRSVAVSHYTLTSGDDRSMDPKSWILSASDNNVSWIILDTQTDQVFPGEKEKREYYFINKTSYKYYKLNILSNNGGSSTQIAEWTLQIKDDPNLPFSVNIDNQNTNMPTGGVITSQYSDSPSGSNILKIVDAKSNTTFITYHDEFYISWEGNKEVSVNYYALTSASDGPEMDPESWTLSASDDNISWTVLDTQTDQLFEKREEKKEYFFGNSTAYKYYKLDILSNNGGEATQIAEWAMKGLPTDMDDLMTYSSGRTFSSATPMGKRFENRHATTAADKVWLATASNEPALLNSASSLTQLKEFPVTLYPYGTPMPADVNQHAIGDCSALAVFASFAYIYPDFIKDIITDNGDKTYTVAMYDPQGKPVDVTVTSKFLADKNGKIGAVTGKYDRATWSTVLEKAMMKWQNIYKVNEDIGGIGTEHAAPLFTGDGDSFAFSADKLNAQQLYRAVTVSLIQGKIVVGGFKKSDVPVSGNHKTVSGHAFTMMHSLDRTALFSMRNPWGGGGDGVLNIPDNNVVPPLIDVRIVNPGKAAKYAKGIKEPYTPPYYSPSQNVIRVAEELLHSVAY